MIRGAQERLSPILMTALATALALVAAGVFGNRPGQEIEYPMAIVILGGLATSTVLNLFVVPSLYLWARQGRPGLAIPGHRPALRRAASAVAGACWTGACWPGRACGSSSSCS